MAAAHCFAKKSRLAKNFEGGRGGKLFSLQLRKRETNLSNCLPVFAEEGAQTTQPSKMGVGGSCQDLVRTSKGLDMGYATLEQGRAPREHGGSKVFWQDGLTDKLSTYALLCSFPFFPDVFSFYSFLIFVHTWNNK